MRTIHLFSKKSIWLLLFCVIAAFTMVNISSCNGNGPKGTCLSLSKSKIKKSWNPEYKNRNDSNRPKYLKFFTTYDPIKRTFRVSAMAYKGPLGKYQPIGSYIKLSNGNSCPTDLPTVAVGENTIDIDDLYILDSNGKLRDFAYISLKPYADTTTGFLRYKIDVVDKNRVTILELEPPSTNPCPPCINCIPPCPTNCKPICEVKYEDSLKTNTPIADTANDQ